jgi:rSAM/selenodomain-associated transferase 2
MLLSVIIPTYNEQENIEGTLQAVLKHDTHKYIHEVLVVDGGSTDNTCKEVGKQGASRFIISPRKGRASQMNYGASIATGEVLYFLHADTIPPIGFTLDIVKAVNQGHSAGCYRLTFDCSHWFLKLNAWFTRFDVNAFRFGDQSLFVTKQKFLESSGFCEKHIVMEDHELIKRLKKMGSFIIMERTIATSARKYLVNGIFKTQSVFFLIYFMYYLGFSQHTLIRTYRRLLKQDKV